jgi:hypothetical protein
MDMTRRQFALALAAATYLRPSLFEPLSPLGVPRGVVPGRVTWAHDPAAMTWDGTGSWWTDANNEQSVIDRMVSRSICGLTNQKNDAPAWSSIFQYFNRTHGRGKAGYKAGEKIAIKANLNNIPGDLYDKIHHEFPGVTFVDHIGGGWTSKGRVQTQRDSFLS